MDTNGNFTRLPIAVIGLGLMGGSLAGRLVEKRHFVVGWNRTKAVAEEALHRGLISSDREEDLAKADLVIFCTPRRATMAFLKEHMSLLKPGALLTDISGVKGHFPREVMAMLPEGFDFVSGHPMCGREGAGLSQADPAMFEGASWLITPVTGNTREHIQRIERLAEDVGARPSLVATGLHDAGVAYTSDLTHAIAASLVMSPSFSDRTRDFMGGAYRDATRVADINGKLWTSLFLENREKLLEEIDRFQDTLTVLRGAVEKGDAAAIAAFLDEAAKRKRSLNDKKESGT